MTEKQLRILLVRKAGDVLVLNPLGNGRAADLLRYKLWQARALPRKKGS